MAVKIEFFVQLKLCSFHRHFLSFDVQMEQLWPIVRMQLSRNKRNLVKRRRIPTTANRKQLRNKERPE